MCPTQTPTGDHRERAWRVRGTVQGVGFRPFVARVAGELGLAGWVRNDPAGVLIRARGEEEQLDALLATVRDRPPAAARVVAIDPVQPAAAWAPIDGQFVILESTRDVPEIATGIPADLALCADCRRELADPADRRHGYPFINCTQCGPRYSIIDSLPYDRPRTTMRCFAMCPECRREYESPVNRRFHAEPNACPVCGPRLTLTNAGGTVLAVAADALTAAAIALRAGNVVAVKGLGGFHLMCDAANAGVVGELRHRKHRDEKPFAVMFADVAAVRVVAQVSDEAAALLTSPAAPIVLVPRRIGAPLADEVAPGNPWIGALVAATPVHVRLLAAVRGPVVATSGNLAEEPLCTDDDEARQRLAGIADVFLGHDRAIARPVDDSVVRWSDANGPILLRRARGYAPSPLALPGALTNPVLCVGAHMKSTVAIASRDRVVLSPHIGDLGGPATRGVFARTIATLSELVGSRPERVVCDAHPDYASTAFARDTGLPVVPVQHHLAHVLAVALDHRVPPEGILGVAWDGTGYGEDGTIWGGEFLLLGGGRARRFARLRPFRLPGGEAAMRDVRRSAVGLAYGLGVSSGRLAAERLGFSGSEAAILERMLETGLNAPECTSVGRLFDAFGALLGLRTANAFEGQTPLAVEIAARQAGRHEAALPFAITPASAGAVWELDWRPAMDVLLTGRFGAPALLARAFHRGLARALAEVARRAAAESVVLSGGCFQNALLLDLACAALGPEQRVLLPRELPPNDGAIAAGQAYAAWCGITTVDLPDVASATARSAGRDPL